MRIQIAPNPTAEDVVIFLERYGDGPDEAGGVRREFSRKIRQYR
jgi:hypothetical protein